ncbi:hypothetical protein U9M48_038458 [Paspalum notatum var. saurae]|uniref:Uncharacterized protein n=1 Tax=Paspalum notatum var. saurae TaxID=547442 RepID=A0AAQ3ULW2_PASNO
MAHNLAIMLLALAYVVMVATPFTYAAKSPSRITLAKAAGGASVEAPETTAEGPTKGPSATMTWPDGGPEMVDFVIKNPYFGSPPSSGKNLAIDPTPEGSNDGLPIDPTPEGSMG